MKYYIYKIVGCEITKEEYEDAQTLGKDLKQRLFDRKIPVSGDSHIIEYATGRRPGGN